VILAFSKRWHLWRHRFAKWALRAAVMPAAMRLNAWVTASASLANEQYDKARLRMEVCRRCPLLSASGTCSACGCYMHAKTQLAAAKCPHGRW